MIKKRICSLVLCLAQMLSAAYVFADGTQSEAEAYVQPENEIQIFVSPDGSDSNNGSYSAPLKTINAGISRGSSELGKADGKKVSVNIRGGDYRISSTIKITASGKADNPLVIQGYKDEKVNIKMSTALIPSKFKQLTDESVLNEIPSEARKYIGVYDIKDALKTMNVNNSRFIVNDSEQTVARWPNTGFDRVNQIVNQTTFTGQGAGNRASKWAKSTNAFVKGYFGVEYSFSNISLLSASGSNIELSQKPYYDLGMNNRYFIENLIQELDSPGEYYVDLKSKKLYYYPTYNISKASIEFTDNTNTMITGSGISNITFKNLSFSGTMGDCMNFTDSSNITVDGCEIKHIGKNAVYMENVTNSTIKNSTIAFIGKDAVYMTGGDRAALTSSGNVIENNHIHDFATEQRTDGRGIWVDGVGALIQYNLLNNSTGSAVRFGGNEHKILYNEMYNVTNEPCDAGAIYSGRNYTYRGIEVAYNYIHDIDTTANKSGSIFVAGIYYDDLMSSAYTHHNILYKCNLGIMIGGGRDHVFENNIVADCDNGLFFDARGVGWAAYHAAKGGQAYNTIAQVPYNKSPWKEKYPELVSILDNPDDLGKPMNNTVKNNILYRCMSNMVANEFKEYGTYENNFESKTDGSYFEDLENRNFNLKKDSGMAKDFPGIAEIDISKIGLLKEKADAEVKNAENAGFRLISPTNGETGISNLESRFMWDKHDGSDKYIVKIASDPEMKDVIIEQETKENFVDIQFIPSGKKPFWWTVTGVNTSQSMGGTFNQTGVPRLLITTPTEKKDKKALSKNLDICRKLYDSIQEGSAAGTFKKGYKDMVKNALDAGVAANESAQTQKEIVAANDGITKVIGELSQYVNYDVINVGDMIADKSGWNTIDGKFTFGNDKTLTLSGSEGRTTHYELCGYDSPLPECTAVKFGYKVNVSSNYCILGLQNTVDAFLRGGYNIIVKSNQLEVQKLVEGTTGNAIKESVLNFYISDNKWVDLEMGALQLGIGTYVFLKADDYLVAEFLDMDAPIWSGDVKFTFSNPSGTSPECVAAIRPAKD